MRVSMVHIDSVLLSRVNRQQSYLWVVDDPDIIYGKYSGGLYTGRIRRGVQPKTGEVSYCADGQGTWVYDVSGDPLITYEGQWRDGAASGYGICTLRFLDGRVSTYSGEWQDNAHHGKGTHIEEDRWGNVLIHESGVFERGRLVNG